MACESPPSPAPNPSATQRLAATAPAPPASTPAAAPAASPPAEASPPTQITAQHVLVAWAGAKGAPKAVKRSKVDARKRAEEVVGKARGGADFSELVKEYSDDTATVPRQGNLGKFAHGDMVKPFADAAFALKVGGISDVVESPFGYHVIKRNQ